MTNPVGNYWLGEVGHYIGDGFAGIFFRGESGHVLGGDYVGGGRGEPGFTARGKALLAWDKSLLITIQEKAL
jgi:hypothetical protein